MRLNNITFASLLISLVGLNFDSMAQATASQNFLMSNAVKQSGVFTEAAVNALPIATQGKTQSISYFDGISRALQNISTQGSASQKDIIVGIEYDQYGREVKKYLPFADQGSSAFGSYKDRWNISQAGFYSGALPNVDIDNSPYSVAVIESSPLNRILGQGAPGYDWQPNTGTHFNQIQYLINKADDRVRNFNVDSSGNITSLVYYPDGQLTMKLSMDEQGQVIKEFTDQSNHIILKRVMILSDSLQTYYLYDNLGMLRAVIQPEGTVSLQAANWVFPVGFSAKWMFLYRYDNRNRMVMKKVPGADSVNMLYDQWDRVVLTQDGNFRTTHNFIFTKYDQLNRPIVTGQITDARALSAVITDVAAATGRFETVNTSATEGYTLNGTFPSSSTYTLTVYTTTHYDSYANLPSWSSGYSFVNEYGIAPQNNFLNGQVVASQVRILGSANFNRIVTYYDDKYRVIQTTSDNAAGGKDRLTKILSFEGKVTNDYRSHTSRFYTTPMVIKQAYTYDHMDRLLTITHQTGSQEIVTIAQNTYNELGQLLNKKIHQSPSHPNALQKLDMYYNIRGWLSSINRPANFETGYEESDLFNMEMHYNSVSMGGAAVPEFNGNISEIEWKGGYDENVRGFNYTYDQANRLLSSNYGSGVAAGNTVNYSFSKKYNESGISYDHNGNFTTMTRFHGDWGKIDSMAYQNYNGNKLGRVDDLSGSPSTIGFQDKTSGTGYDYNYDSSGNLTSDFNKSITSITYNYLNLPQVVTIAGKGTITYTYDASGNKLQKTTFDQTITPNKTTNYYYAGDFIYRNDTLEFISHPEGRLRPLRIDTTQAISIANLKYIYDYYLKDHLGSVRSVLTTEQQTDFYAATMEAAAATKEDTLFSNVSSTSTAKPGGFTSDANNLKVSKLNGNTGTGGKRLGPSIILKVMAGDTISLSTLCWYTGGSQPPPNGIPAIAATDLLPMLTAGIAGAGGNKLGAIPAGTADPLLSNDLANFLTNTQSYVNTQPKAFLNWMVIDEEFNAVSSPNHLGAKQVPVFNAGDSNRQVVGLQNMVVRRNGWIYIYLSNESAQDVYFDNLVINLKHGPLLEQKDYYAFGMEISSLCTQAIKTRYKTNRNRYNGKELQNAEFSDGSGLEEYDFRYRFYDPQLGVFHNQDRLADKFAYMSPYQYCSNNPIWLKEIDGLEGVKYTESDDKGNKRTVVEKNVKVVLDKNKEIPKGATQKQIEKITKQNLKIQERNGEKLNNVQTELNLYYNGAENKGAEDTQGNSVYFKFNVSGMNDIDKKGMSLDQENSAYMGIANKNGLSATSQFDCSRIVAPAGILTDEMGGDKGTTVGAKVMRLAYTSPEGATAHEVGHTLGLQDNNYTSGGVLNWPPGQVNSSEVDEILKQAYEK